MSALPAPGAIVGGRYRVETLLGQGGMGAVFAATNVATGGEVVLKWLLPDYAREPDAIARFVREAQAMARIEHPNVVGILDAGAEQGAPFLVMERLRGESLGARMRRGPLSVAEALDAILSACRGVAAAHAEGIVHRDLKPDNIFLCRGKDGSPREAKVLDFGVAKLMEQDVERLTQTGISMGTPYYMCPEQLDAPRIADPRFDVYAMGVVLYQALTGRLPYEAEGIFELCDRIAKGRATPIHALAPHVPPALEAVVMRAMHVKASQRHASMRELIAELERVRANPSERATTERPVWILVAALGLGAILVLGALGVGYLLLRGEEEREPPPPPASVEVPPDPIAAPIPPPPPPVDAGPPPIRSELTITECDVVFRPMAHSMVRTAFLNIGTDVMPGARADDHYLYVQTNDVMLPDVVELGRTRERVDVKLAIGSAEWWNYPRSAEAGRIEIRRIGPNHAELTFENVVLRGPYPRDHALGSVRPTARCVLNGRLFL